MGRADEDDDHHPRRPPRPAGDRLLTSAVREAGPWLAPLVLLELAGAGATAALPAVLGQALDQVMTEGTGARHALVVAVALIGLLAIEDVGGQLLSGAGTARSTATLRRRLGRHLLAVGPRVLTRGPDGDLVARLVGGTATAARGVTVVSGLAVMLVPPAVGVVALALIDPWLAVTFAAGMAALTGAVRTYLRAARAATEGYLAAQADIAARLVDALAGARTIAAARTVPREVGRVLGPLPELRRHGAAVWQNLSRLAFQGEPVVLLTQAAVIAVAGLGLTAGRLTPGETLAASRYAVLASGIAAVVDQLAGLTRARAGAERVADVLAEPATPHGDRRPPGGPGRLELTAVRAGPDGAPVLDGVDLVVPSGALVALVGRSGGGKSLLAALAGRLVDPTAGEVRLDGVPLPHLDRRALRRSVAYAFERPVLVGDTVHDAIALGPERADPGTVAGAARAARADRFVRRLPGGYGAVLRDTPMSGGEVQRIGLARALARPARVLILDDALSSLDTATEAEIAGALVALAGRTRLVVTHRLATAARADLVAWLDGGAIRAVGPHRELWRDPAYRALFGAVPEPVAVAEAGT